LTFEPNVAQAFANADFVQETHWNIPTSRQVIRGNGRCHAFGCDPGVKFFDPHYGRYPVRSHPSRALCDRTSDANFFDSGLYTTTMKAQS
jgi:hypothetical protein